MSLEEVIERAGEALPTRGGIRQLVESLDPGVIAEAFGAAGHDLDAQVNLALAAVASGVELPTEALAKLAPDVLRWESLALLLAPEASRTAILDALLAAPWTPLEHRACAVALRLYGSDPEDAPLARAELRQMLRAQLPSLFHDELILATGRALREHDPHIALLYERATVKLPELHPEAIASPGRLAEHVAKADISVLPEHVERRHAPPAPKVGRNDPCPCGSGKKFKKCCGRPGATPAITSDPDRLRPDKRLSREALLEEPTPILARLPFGELEEQTHLVVLGQLALMRHLHGLGRALDAWLERPIDDVGKHDEGILEGLLTVASYARHFGAARVQAWVDALRLEDSRAEARELIAAATPGSAGDLAALEEAFRAGLDAPPGRTLDLAVVMLAEHPALAAYLLRGIALDAHPLDGEAAADYVAYARDRVGARPDDPLPTVLRLLDRDDAHADAREASVAKERAARQALQEQLDELRAAMRRTRKANEALEAELEEGRRALEKLEADDADEGAPAVDPEELRRLRTKVRELKGRIEEGKRERTALRGQLDEAERTTPDDAPKRPETPDEEEEADEEPLEPTRLRVPDWSSRARKSLTTLPASIAQQSIVLAAQLATGDPLARRGAKKLEGFEHLRRARVGIHYRLLYVLHDDTLEVVDVLARENLDSHLGRLRKTIG